MRYFKVNRYFEVIIFVLLFRNPGRFLIRYCYRTKTASHISINKSAYFTISLAKGVGSVNCYAPDHDS